ncbi:MAG: Bvg accessory factor [Thermomicrobiales bacterium]|jgi:type III pantothenate kinase|nr:Bvg accessory factor [Thermomicrobiales bacterium]
MLLAVEVGNSNTTFGLFATSGELTSAYRLSTERERMPDEWFAMLAALLASDGHDLSEVDGAIISSVVPSVTTWLVDMTRTRLRIDPVIVTGDLDVGLDLDVDEPRQLGADRIVDCVAAFHRYGGPAIIVDLGTATTFDVIGRNGAYKGGAIAAGVATSLQALAGNAAQLFNVELHMPEAVIGRNTADQLRSGIVAGHLAMLEGMIERTRAELGTDAQVIVTGGLAPLFADRSSLLDHFDADLTLHGLRLIYDRVRAVQEPAAASSPAGSRRVSAAAGRQRPDAI